MKLIPFGKRTIVKPIANKEVMSGGIIIASTVQNEFSDIGIVVESDKYHKDSQVVLPPYKLSHFTVDGESYYSVFTCDILGEINVKQ